MERRTFLGTIAMAFAAPTAAIAAPCPTDPTEYHVSFLASEREELFNPHVLGAVEAYMKKARATHDFRSYIYQRVDLAGNPWGLTFVGRKG